MTDSKETMPTPVTKAAVITVSTNVLEAVAKWAGTDETRPHLHQVHFTKGTMIAVDGHRMVIVPCETFGKTLGIDRQYLLAAVAAQRALTRERPNVITIEEQPNPVFIRLGLTHPSGKVCLQVPVADASAFPPYEQVLRDSENAARSPSPSGYAINPKYLAAVAEVDAATCDANEIIAGSRGVRVIGWSKDRLGAMVFVNKAGVKFVVMPMRP